MEFRRERFGSPAWEEPPYTGASITTWRAGADGVASLEREIFLDIGKGRVIVVFDFAELEEAKAHILVFDVFSGGLDLTGGYEELTFRWIWERSRLRGQ
jgi:hypothetical protein